MGGLESLNFLSLASAWHRARLAPVGLLVVSCATPIREDPPSQLGATDSDGSSGGSGGSGAAVTVSSTNTSATGTTSSSGSSTTSTSATSTSGSNATSASADTSSSSTTSADTNTSATTSTSATATTGTDGTGGSTSASTVASTSTVTTGGITIIDDLPFVDDFEGYTPNAPADPNWTMMDATGAWTVLAEASNQFYAPEGTADNRNMTHAGNPEWTNVRFEADVRLRAGAADSTRIYLAVRAAPSSSDGKLDYYHGYLTGAGRIQLGQYVGGSTSEDTSAHRADTGVTLDSTSWHRFAVTIDGDTLTAALDGTDRVSGTLTGLSAGFVAIGVDGDVAELDNVSVTEP